MEMAKVEIAAIEKVAAPNVDVVLLSELQLSLVGGGTGDVQLG
jgi:hypothetical protein